MNQTLRAYFLMTGFAFMAMISYLCVDWVLRLDPNLYPGNAFFWGCSGGVILSLPYFLSHQKTRRELVNTFSRHGGLITLITLLTTIGGCFWFWALDLSNSGIISILSKSETLWVFLLGFMFLKEKITWPETLGIGVALVGLYLTSTLEGEVSLTAVMLILAGKFLYALQSLLTKKYGSDLQAMSFAFLRGGLMAVFLGIIFGLLDKIEWVGWSTFLLLALGQFCGIFLGRVFYFEAHKHADISRLNTFLFLEPVFVLVGAYLVFGDTVGGQKLLGAILTLGGLLFFVRAQTKNKTGI